VNQRGGGVNGSRLKDSNKTNTTSSTRLRLTTQVGQAHTATGVLLDLGTNKQPSEPKLTNTHNENLHGLLQVLHRSDRWPALVRPVDSADQASGYSSRTTSGPKSLSDSSRPWNKNTPKTQLAQKVLTVKIRQPSHEFTFGVGMSFIPYPLVLTPVV
jgi:hypothetical protein